MPTGRPTGNGRSCRYCIVGLIRNIKDINILYDSCPQLSKMVEPDIFQSLLSESKATSKSDSGEVSRMEPVDVHIPFLEHEMERDDVGWTYSGNRSVEIQRVEFLFSCHSMTPSLALSAGFEVRGDNFIVKLAIE